MAASLPRFPRVVFTIIEPISLVAGFIGVVADPDWFIAEQAPITAPLVSSVHARVVALQLGNLYLLMAMVGLAVLSTTSEVKVVRNYIIALWIADLGHIFACWLAMGDAFFDVARWNAMAWGNVGMTLFLCLTRSGWLLGFFGPDAVTDKPTVKRS
ncbi:hypothetical protein B0T11DRAFT_100304 [Plectosphaerella cucumerina]|uniref:DUF7704 domain-containing protein n=1 Tax=Plectosphaerella cucumerina TaxID=40658 RepID=A0A8K0X0Y5_9PEZI|nr:hypothetical protein B0T11DRAFT_100304 [Plectosphaerella cucumerina]